MGELTVSQIITFILGLAGLFGAISTIQLFVQKVYTKSIEKKILKPIEDELNEHEIRINDKLNKIEEDIKTIDIGSCRNFLVAFLGSVERGEKLDPVEIQRAYDVMEHYTEDLKMNSYVHARWIEVMEKGNKNTK